MFGESRLLQGLLAETATAADSQVAMWDRSTVWQVALKEATSRSELARTAEHRLRNAMNELRGEAQPSAQDASKHPLDPVLEKFCRLIDYAGLRIETPPSIAELTDLGQRVEQDAIYRLRESTAPGMVARARGTAQPGFKGDTLDDLVRHVTRKLFENLEAQMQQKSPAEREEIAEQIAAALHDLPPEGQERLRHMAGIPDLTSATLMRTGAIAALGIGVSSLIEMAGFSAFTVTTSLLAAVTSLIGVHLSFHAFAIAASATAFLHNPVAWVALIGGGGAMMSRSANRSIRDALYPTLVTLAVVADVGASRADAHLPAFCALVGERVAALNAAAGSEHGALAKRFPGLGRSQAAIRWPAHEHS